MKLRLCVQEIRKKQYLTIRELAEKSGVAKSTLQEIERGSTINPRLETMYRLAKALNVKIDDLCQEE